MTQGYLICTSVLLVWQLSRFDEYTSFSLLLALAFYDLCAVLSPCGPLKALVVLMQERKVPLPVNGLSYSNSKSDDCVWCSTVSDGLLQINSIPLPRQCYSFNRGSCMKLIYQKRAASMVATEQVGQVAVKA